MRRVFSLALAFAVVVSLTTNTSSASAASKKSVGTIVIPRLKLRAPIYMGITNQEFNLGIGQWPGTPKFGRKGNIVLGGHRTSAFRPFEEIQNLRSGDLIALISGTKTHRYRVTGRSIVKPTAVWITSQTKTPTLTLFSCHPKGKTTHRYVVRAVLIK
jgi:sortase A